MATATTPTLASKAITAIVEAIEEVQAEQKQYAHAKESGPEWTHLYGQIQGLMRAKRIIGNLAFGEIIE